MSYSANILNPKIPKHPLVILHPRKRLTGWTLYSGTIWVADYTGPLITRAWRTYENDDGLEVETAYPPVSGIFQDTANGKIYWLYGTAPGPDDAANALVAGTIPGLTIEVGLFLSDEPHIGPSDPLDPNSVVVEWKGSLKSFPEADSGNKTALYGFNPITDTAVDVQDQDGWLMPYLYDYTFNQALVRSFMMADSDILEAAIQGNTKEIFRGYSGQPKENTSGTFSVECFDFLALLENPNIPAAQYSTAFPAIDPAAVGPGKEWWIRRVRGLVDNFEAVNIDYSKAASITNNRKWSAIEGTPGDGTIVQTVKTAGVTNTTTKTYTSTTPQLNIGDCAVVQRSGVDKYVIVATVNRAAGFFTHNAIAGTALNTDTVTRFYIGWVKIKDGNGTWWNLMAGRDFSMIDNVSEGIASEFIGFKLANNFEAVIGFTDNAGIFDPSRHQILCRVYGTAVLDLYADGVHYVGAVSDEGGVASNGVSLLFWLLTEAGLSKDLIDRTSFAAVPTTHELGLAIPDSASSTTLARTTELIQKVLQSMLWKMDYVDLLVGIGVGLFEAAPFGAADFTADDTEFRDFELSIDYSSLADFVSLSYAAKEQSREGEFDIFLAAAGINSPDGTQKVTATNLYARQVHFIRNTFELDLLQFLPSQAQVMANRYSYALGDRRAFYYVALGPEFIQKAQLAKSYNLSRKAMPGNVFDGDTQFTRQLLTTESTKSAQAVTLTLEDQKGIQDNAGVW